MMPCERDALVDYAFFWAPPQPPGPYAVQPRCVNAYKAGRHLPVLRGSIDPSPGKPLSIQHLHALSILLTIPQEYIYEEQTYQASRGIPAIATTQTHWQDAENSTCIRNPFHECRRMPDAWRRRRCPAARYRPRDTTAPTAQHPYSTPVKETAQENHGGTQQLSCRHRNTRTIQGRK